MEHPQVQMLKKLYAFFAINLVRLRFQTQEFYSIEIEFKSL
jgi:hypothetical protein